MNIWIKLLTALRGGATEMGEAMIETQALRILDQEIRDASCEMDASKEALADIMAKHIVVTEHITDTVAKIEEYEQHALSALAAGQELLATEVAQKIAYLETSLFKHQAQAQHFALSTNTLRKTVIQTQDTLQNLQQQVDIAKATDSVQRAQMLVSQRFGGSKAKLDLATESLARIKRQQTEQAAKITAKSVLNADLAPDAALDGKLRAAGIVASQPSATNVLDRLKQKAKS